METFTTYDDDEDKLSRLQKKKSSSSLYKNEWTKTIKNYQQAAACDCDFKKNEEEEDYAWWRRNVPIAPLPNLLFSIIIWNLLIRKKREILLVYVCVCSCATLLLRNYWEHWVNGKWSKGRNCNYYWFGWFCFCLKNYFKIYYFRWGLEIFFSFEAVRKLLVINFLI